MTSEWGMPSLTSMVDQKGDGYICEYALGYDDGPRTEWVRDAVSPTEDMPVVWSRTTGLGILACEPLVKQFARWTPDGLEFLF